MSIAYPCYCIESYDDAMPFWLDYLQFTVDFEYREKESAPVYTQKHTGMTFSA